MRSGLGQLVDFFKKGAIFPAQIRPLCSGSGPAMFAIEFGDWFGDWFGAD